MIPPSVNTFVYKCFKNFSSPMKVSMKIHLSLINLLSQLSSAVGNVPYKPCGCLICQFILEGGCHAATGGNHGNQATGQPQHPSHCIHSGKNNILTISYPQRRVGQAKQQQLSCAEQTTRLTTAIVCMHQQQCR